MKSSDNTVPVAGGRQPPTDPRLRLANLGLGVLGLGLVVILVVLAIVMGIANPLFFTERNLQNVLLQSSVVALLGIGQLLVILTRGIDLSVGSIMGFSSVIAGMTMGWAFDNGLTAVLALALTGAVVGFTNGVIFVKGRIPHPFIVISPSAPDQLKPVLTRAQDEGIHVLLLDTNIPDFDAATFIGTDNRAGGATAYEALIDAIGDTGGKVGMIGGAPGVTSVEDRVAGFVGAAEGSSFEILETLATTSCDQESGVANAENLITAHPDLKAIFIGCGQPALGAIQAVKSAGLAGKITIIGFDFDPGAADALKEGSAAAFVNQAPAKMGSTGVESAYTLLTGGTIEKSIDTGVATITIDNVADFE